ncbi:MAG TPA: S-layer homology domain-containing protein [Symbiobacteriaceae bacterium]|nr:S-layer homology domain-containing protein [Symbiobacteriaceae bacterium]
MRGDSTTVALLAAAVLAVTVPGQHPVRATSVADLPPALTISSQAVGAAAMMGEEMAYTDGTTGDLHVFDLRTWNQSTTATVVNPRYAAIGPDFVAYTRSAGKQEAMIVQRLSDGWTRTLQTTTQGYYQYPMFAGMRVLYIDRSASNQGGAALVYDSVQNAQGELGPIPTEGFKNWRPGVTWRPIIHYDGRYAVWTEERDSGTTIVAMDACCKQTKTGRSLFATAVDNGRVVYLDWAPDQDGQWVMTIRLWDITANTDTAIATASMSGFTTTDGEPRAVIGDPDIKGNNIAWVTGSETTGYNLMFHDLRTGTTTQLTTDGTPKENVLLGDRYVLFQTINAAGNDDRLIALPLHPLPPRVVLTHPDQVPPASFEDLSRTHWAIASIDLAVAKGLMQGRPGNRFEADSSMTRAEFLTVLMRAYPQSGPMGAPFDDTPLSHWASDTIRLARGAGLVQGNNNRFEPDRPITRAEMAVMLQNFVQLTAPDAPVSFPDLGGAIWAAPAIDALVANDVLRGLPDGTFDPLRAITRAEAATVVGRLFQPQ